MTNEFNIQSLFVSSTFRDMQVERDLIRDKLLPKLNELSAEYKKMIEVVDLRWGIDTSTIDNDFEAQEKILNVCLDEIDRCKPYIIVLLGDRYGWVPDMDMLSSVAMTKNFPVTERKSVTALEIEYGALKSPDRPKAFFYFRSITNKQEISDKLLRDYLGNDEEKEKLEQLKAEIRNKFPDNVRDYTVVWDKQKNEVTGLDSFEEILCKDILTAIQEENAGQVLSDAWQEKELNAQARVLFQKRSGFVGRGNIISNVRKYLFDSDSPYLLLKGVSGSGKSSLFAQLVHTFREEKEAVVFPFLCGTTGASSNLITLLELLIYQVSAFLHEEAPREFNDVQEAAEELFRLLHILPKDKKYIIAVDALDELARSDNTNRMVWLLLNRLPENVKFFGTIVDGPEIDAIEAVGGRVLRLTKMEDDDVDQMIQAFQRDSHKTLSQKVIRAIREKKGKDGTPSSQSPLYLSLILQDLKMIDRYEFAAIEKMAIERFANNRDEALEQFMIGRIANTDGSIWAEYLHAIQRCERLIGEEFSKACLGLIAVSRFGLTEAMLEKCFAIMQMRWDSAGFAWLRQILAPHFARSEYGEWDFNHRILRSTVRTSLLSKEEWQKFNAVIVTALEREAVSEELVARDIVYHYYYAREYGKIAGYIADKQMAFEINPVKRAFEVYLHLLNDCAVQYREQMINRLVNILDAAQDLEYRQQVNLVYAYSMQMKEMIRQNTGISCCEVFCRKIIEAACKIHERIKASKATHGIQGIGNELVLMEAFLPVSEFFIEEGYTKEARWVFDKFEGMKWKTTDLLRNLSMEYAELIGAIIKSQMAMTNKQLSFAIASKDFKNAAVILAKAKRNLQLIRIYRVLFSNRLFLLRWAFLEKILNFTSEKTVSFFLLFKAIYFLNKEWNYVAIYEVQSREFDLLLAQNNRKKLDRIYRKMMKLIMKESKFYNIFEGSADFDNVQLEVTNAMMAVVEQIRTYHRAIESDNGVFDDKLLSIDLNKNPADALKKYTALAEFSEQQYKRYGGIFYTSNYAIRLANVAESYFSLEQYEEAIDWYLKATDVLKTLLKHERYKDYAKTASCLEQAGRAALFCGTEDYAQLAENLFDAVRELREAMKKDFPDQDMGLDLAIAYYNLAIAQNELKKYDLALKNFSLASDIGYAPATNYLGIAYEYGKGVEMDLEQARSYYKLAYARGDDNGRINLERLK